jgi:ubiquinone/menaquinone biosynthesis C-methylase UbiE
MAAEDIAASYAELADRAYRWDRFDRLFTGRYRRQQFGDADGRVLDVACGTGTNFPDLPEDIDLVGIDISPEMLANARDRLGQLAVNGTLHEMDAQDLSFPDDFFDTVVSALSTCTFPDPIAALQEMERVCKPDGRILLLEHGLIDIGALAWFQEWRADAHYAKTGCRWTQEPLAVVSEAGLSVENSSTYVSGLLTTIEARPRT